MMFSLKLSSINTQYPLCFLSSLKTPLSDAEVTALVDKDWTDLVDRQVDLLEVPKHIATLNVRALLNFHRKRSRLSDEKLFANVTKDLVAINARESKKSEKWLQARLEEVKASKTYQKGKSR